MINSNMTEPKQSIQISEKLRGTLFPKMRARNLIYRKSYSVLDQEFARLSAESNQGPGKSENLILLDSSLIFGWQLPEN